MKKMILSIFLFQTIVCSHNTFKAIIATPPSVSASIGIVGGALAKLYWEYSHKDLDAEAEIVYVGPTLTYLASALIATTLLPESQESVSIINHLMTVPIYFLSYIIVDTVIEKYREYKNASD